MSIYFVDSSALAKRYLPEIGSIWVQTWIEPAAGHTIVISELATVELISLMSRSFRAKVISHGDYVALESDFLWHSRHEYKIVKLRATVLSQARGLVKKYTVRSLDSIQLVSAIIASRELNAKPTFISADLNLLKAAAAEGFPTDDPNAHP